MADQSSQVPASGDGTKLRRWVAFTALVIVAAGLGRPLFNQLLDPSDPRDQPEVATPVTTAEPVATPRNQGTRLEWAPGIQTWRHWYVGGSDQHLANLHRQGFGWVKQRFAWADLQVAKGGDINFLQPEMFLGGVEGAGSEFNVLIQLDVPPEWAFAHRGIAGVEDHADLDAWLGFVTAFAQRFAGRVHAYEIGNEPNLAVSAWSGEPDPLAYAAVLATAYGAIKTADPNALVVSAGLSPTGNDMPKAMDDEEYLRALYEARYSLTDEDVPVDTATFEWAEAYPRFFDALGAHAAGFRAAPEVSPEEAAADPQLGGQRYFTFRRIEDLRRVMEEMGDAGTPVVVTEFGWTTDERSDSPYTWSAVSREERVDYTRRAFQYAADNWADWVGPMFLFTAPDPSWGPDHEAYWRAVTDNEGWLVDGLSLAGLGVVAQTPVGVAPDVEAESTMRAEERIAPLPLVLADLPALGSGFAQLPDGQGSASWPQVRHVGGAITAASRDGNRLALAQGRYVVLMDISDPVQQVEVARSAPFDSMVGAVALRGELIAAGFPERGGEPARIVLLHSVGELLELASTLALPSRPADTVLLDRGAPPLHLADRELLTAQSYCGVLPVEVPSAATHDPGPSDDCSLVVYRITNLEGTPSSEEALRAPTHWRNYVEPALGDAVVFVVGQNGLLAYMPVQNPDAYMPGQEGYQVAGEVDLGPAAGGIVWMSVADQVLTVLAEGGGTGQTGGKVYPATLYALDVTDPAHPVGLGSVPVDGNGGFRDHGVVGVLQPDCDGRSCRYMATLIDVAGTTPRTIAQRMLTSAADSALPVAVDGVRLWAADAFGLSAHRVDESETGSAAARGGPSLPHTVDAVVRLTSDRAAYLAGGRLAVFDAAAGFSASTPVGPCGSAEAPVPMDVAALGSLALVVLSGGGLAVVDPDLSNPQQIACVELPDYLDSRFVAAEGSHAYIVGPYGSGPEGVGLTVVDVSRPTRPEVVGLVSEAFPTSAGSESQVADVAVAGGRAYIATGGSSDSLVFVLDVADPAGRLVGRLPTPATAVLAVDGRLFVAVSCPYGAAAYSDPAACVAGLRVYDTTGPGLPREVGNLGTTFEFQSLAMADDGLWALGDGALWLLNVSDPAHPRIVDRTAPGVWTGADRVGSQSLFSFPAAARALAVVGSQVLAAEGAGGLTILDMAGGGAD